MSDRLAAVLAQFSVSARVFNAGALCGITDLDGSGETGQLHLIRRGTVEVRNGDGSPPLQVTVPSLLLYPRPMAHRFITDPQTGADFTCAALHFSGGAAHPIARALPAFSCMPLAALDGSEALLGLLFDEASERHCGRQAVLDRLFEVLLIRILRRLMEQGDAEVGMLAGLAHPRLRLALVAIHEQPAEDWSLERLAERAGMSRSRFASAFHAAVGTTPGSYLQQWRVRLAEQALRKGRPLKWIVDEVGYGSEAALSRAFKAQTGLSPRQWRLVQPA